MIRTYEETWKKKHVTGECGEGKLNGPTPNREQAEELNLGGFHYDLSRSKFTARQVTFTVWREGKAVMQTS